MGNDNWLTDYIEDIMSDNKKRFEEAVKKTKREFFPLEVKKVEELYRQVADDFYSDYSERKFYKPRGSLKNLFNIKTDYENLYMDFDPTKIPSRTGYVGEDGLYNTVFREGWHGGANHEGKMLYRKPVPYYRYWGREAVRTSISPLDDFDKRWDKYQETEFVDDLNRIFDKHFKNN